MRQKLDTDNGEHASLALFQGHVAKAPVVSCHGLGYLTCHV